MVNIPPDIALKAIALKAKYAPYVRELTTQFASKALDDAERYRGSHLAYWRTVDTIYFFIYRMDRQPNDEEVLPWLQILFADGQIHENSGPNYRGFFQGNVYTEDTVANMIGNAFANASERDSNAGAFDFDKTNLGKKLGEQGDGR